MIHQRYEAEVPLATLEEHPENPRRGSDALVADSIDALGWFGAILVQESTGHVIAGNTRFRVMREQGAETIPAFIVDCDDETAKRIMLVDNRASDVATYDNSALIDALTSLRDTSTGLVGTGYDNAMIDLLISLTDEGPEDVPPDSFPNVDPDELDTQYRCPSCRYEWSGSPRPGGDDDDDE